MNNFLRLLIERCRADIAIEQSKPGKYAVAGAESNNASTELKKSLSSLLLAESALNKVELCQQFPDHPKQIVVIGPTQVGKSTTVNLLLNRQLAEASATAGYTVHCQGYATTNTDDSWLKTYFSDLQSREQSQLDRNVLDEYSYTKLSVLADSKNHQMPANLPYEGAVIWDTPDFDSIESFGYREPVLKAVALADLVVFVVSKEKYADKTVWDMLAMLVGLSQQVLFVMNKTPTSVRADLAESVRGKYQRLNVADGAELPLYFIDEYPDGPIAAVGSSDVLQLQRAIAKQLTRTQPASLKSATDVFMSTYWAQWTASVAEEHRIQIEWKKKVDDVSADLVKRYQSEYLEHARHKETFQLALAELLALLEVPGLAGPLSRIRNVVTWPVRKLVATASQHQDVSANKKDHRSDERQLLEELAEHGISRLTVELADSQSQSMHWQKTQDKLAAQKSTVLKGYHNGLDNYQILLQVEIERAAQSLYKNLQDQPATLNSLRAARVTADAAAVVLAVKSGGLGAADLVIAPAMLSLTTMMTEGALGKYMRSVENELKSYQRKAVDALIARKIRLKLYPMMTVADAATSISQKQLQGATEKLSVQPVLQPASPTTESQSSENGSSHV